MFRICLLFFRPYQMEDIYKTVKIITVFFNFLFLLDISRNINFKMLISPTRQCVNRLFRNFFDKAIPVQWYTIWILVSGSSQISHKSSVVEHSYNNYLEQGGQNLLVQFCLWFFRELAFADMFWLFISFKMQKTKKNYIYQEKKLWSFDN